MSASIVSFQDASNKEEVLGELKDIFFESSARKTFADQNERDAFFYKYLGWYLEHYPEFCLIFKAGRVLGYVAFAPETHNEELYGIQPHLKTFEKFYLNFPAHLHINCHAESRGQGVGKQLMDQAFNKLIHLKVPGVHIMTGPDSRNKTFYDRLGFDFHRTLTFQGTPILFMGKSLSENKL